MEIEKEKIERIDKNSPYFKEVLEKVPPGIIRWGNSVFLFLFIVAMVALWLVKYPDVLLCEIKVTSDNPAIEVYATSQGKLDRMFKPDFEEVKKGDWIMLFENQGNFKDIKYLENLLDVLMTEDFWLVVDTLNLNSQLSLGTLKTPYIQLSHSLQEFQLFTRIQPQVRQITINESQQSNLKRIVKSLNEQRVVLQQEIDLERLDLDRSRSLLRQSVISAQESEKKEREFLALSARLKEIDQSILNTYLQQNQVSKENTILNIDQSEQYFSLRKTILIRFNELSSAFSQWKKEYVITAPVSGRLNLFEFRNDQQFIRNDQLVFTIVPTDKTTYFALLKLPIANSGKAEVGQEVIMKLASHPYHEFGMLKGKIEHISEVPQDGNYLVKVKLPNQLTTSTQKKINTTRELTGRGEIITQDRRMLERMFSLFSK